MGFCSNFGAKNPNYFTLSPICGIARWSVQISNSSCRCRILFPFDRRKPHENRKKTSRVILIFLRYTCQFSWGLFTCVTSLLLLTKMAATSCTSVKVSPSPITLRPTAATKITSVWAGVTFICSGKALAFRWIYFRGEGTNFRQVMGQNGAKFGTRMGSKMAAFSSKECQNVCSDVWR